MYLTRFNTQTSEPPESYSNILLKNIIFIYNRLCCCNKTCYCISIVSVTSASRYVTSASRYQSRFLMYIRGLIPQNKPRQFRLVVTMTLFLFIFTSLTQKFNGKEN